MFPSFCSLLMSMLRLSASRIELKDQDVERIIRRVEQRSNEFRSSLDSALDKRGYNEARVEYVNTFIERFCDYTKRLRDQFDKRSSSTADVRAVLDRAAPIDEFMINWHQHTTYSGVGKRIGPSIQHQRRRPEPNR